MAIEEYVVLVEDQELDSPFKSGTTWNGAAAGAMISEPGAMKPLKTSRTVRVQAESAAEAIRGVKQTFPTMITGTTYAVLKSSLTTG
jgi:hypothetical protein